MKKIVARSTQRATRTTLRTMRRWCVLAGSWMLVDASWQLSSRGGCRPCAVEMRHSSPRVSYAIAVAP